MALYSVQRRETDSGQNTPLIESIREDMKYPVMEFINQKMEIMIISN